MIIKNMTNKSKLAEKVICCGKPWSRIRGLLGRPRIHDDEACWLVPCNAIHTFGMKYPIDAYFLNKQKGVVAVLKNLKPNRLTPFYLKAYSVLEFTCGPERSCVVGDKLAVEETP
ncbi:MAG: hypothetical protein AUJ72_03755 [Candidatus Omnitrophica bacterium CG1_02_46_14]|nr:MAG: hypothetical protein AUJ72_03755 [Candidatus Omnitrophica bacterium CG1_02_46_14]